MLEKISNLWDMIEGLWSEGCRFNNIASPFRRCRWTYFTLNSALSESGPAEVEMRSVLAMASRSRGLRSEMRTRLPSSSSMQTAPRIILMILHFTICRLMKHQDIHTLKYLQSRQTFDLSQGGYMYFLFPLYEALWACCQTFSIGNALVQTSLV